MSEKNLESAANKAGSAAVRRLGGVKPRRHPAAGSASTEVHIRRGGNQNFRPIPQEVPKTYTRSVFNAASLENLSHFVPYQLLKFPAEFSFKRLVVLCST